ncbi:MAG: cobaltochelatase subunit CobN, partial [Desulfobulbaceae bacterium]|nr:cobaltochelatase subunit CobN [Desulfobulbaceae bacterium]
VYAVSVIEKGVACCDHTCNNPMLNQMVVSIISLPGVMTPEMVEKFKLAIEQMAGKSTENQAADRKELQKQLTAPTGDTKESQQTIKETGVKSEAQAESEVEGYKMEKIKSKDETTQMTSSGVEWLAGLTVLLIIGLAAYGAGRKR